MAALNADIGEVINSEVRAVILFGSIARGEPDPDSDIDLAVIAAPAWNKRVELQETVRTGSATTATYSSSPSPSSVNAPPKQSGRERHYPRRDHTGRHQAARQDRRLMATAEQRNHAKSVLNKGEQYLASAEDNLDLGRYTPAAGDAIHADISAKGEVEYGTALIAPTKAEPLVQRARTLVDLAPSRLSGSGARQNRPRE